VCETDIRRSCSLYSELSSIGVVRRPAASSHGDLYAVVISVLIRRSAHCQRVELLGRLKTRDWKTRHRPKYRGGKHGTGKPGTKSQGWKSRDWKTQYQITGVENAGPENPAPTRRGGKRRNKLYGQPMGQFLQFIEITVSLIL